MKRRHALVVHQRALCMARSALWRELRAAFLADVARVRRILARLDIGVHRGDL